MPAHPKSARKQGLASTPSLRACGDHLFPGLPLPARLHPLPATPPRSARCCSERQGDSGQQQQPQPFLVPPAWPGCCALHTSPYARRVNSAENSHLPAGTFPSLEEGHEYRLHSSADTVLQQLGWCWGVQPSRAAVCTWPVAGPSFAVAERSSSQAGGCAAVYPPASEGVSQRRVERSRGQRGWGTHRLAVWGRLWGSSWQETLEEGRRCGIVEEIPGGHDEGEFLSPQETEGSDCNSPAWGFTDPPEPGTVIFTDYIDFLGPGGIRGAEEQEGRSRDGGGPSLCRGDLLSAVQRATGNCCVPRSSPEPLSLRCCLSLAPCSWGPGNRDSLGQ